MWTRQGPDNPARRVKLPGKQHHDASKESTGTLRAAYGPSCIVGLNAVGPPGPPPWYDLAALASAGAVASQRPPN